MTHSRTIHVRTLVVLGGACVAGTSLADSNVANPKKWTWAENAGWMNWADADARTEGVEIYRGSHLAGFIWAENVGWIDAGDGNAPYANSDGSDYGINIDPITGDMTGFAWSENAGWLNFGPFPLAVIGQSARWNSAQRRSEGYVWSENLGWVNLDDAIRYVCSIPGDVTNDGIVDVFDFGALAANFGGIGNPPFTLGDVDGDGDTDVFDFGDLAANFGFSCP